MKKLIFIFMSFLFTTPIYSMDIFEAAYKNHPTVVQTFIDAGADLNQQNVNGWAPLHCATSGKGNLTIIRMLLAAGANVDHQDSLGWTPLHLAVCEGYQEVVRILIEAHANVNKLNNCGHTPLHIATAKGYQEIVDLINRVNASHEANRQLLALLCATHPRLGAASSIQPLFHADSAITPLIIKYVQKAAWEQALYDHNQ